MTILNLLLPFMNPAEQFTAANTIGATQSPEIQQAVGSSYNRPTAGATSEARWLQGLGGLSQFLDMPDMPPWAAGQGGEAGKQVQGLQGMQSDLAALSGDPNAAALRSLSRVASQAGSASTRLQQREAKSAYENWMGNQSDFMQGIGSQLLNPLLDAPRYGSAATWGTYTNPYSIKGGLVANPWYT
jgi:hypothetical protein